MLVFKLNFYTMKTENLKGILGLSRVLLLEQNNPPLILFFIILALRGGSNHVG